MCIYIYIYNTYNTHIHTGAPAAAADPRRRRRPARPAAARYTSNLANSTIHILLIVLLIN